MMTIFAFSFSVSFALRLAFSLLASIQHVAAAVQSQAPVHPDYYACALELGEALTSSACVNALNNMPISADAIIFSPQPETSHSWNVKVPVSFYDLPRRCCVCLLRSSVLDLGKY